jgi:hypothetical protein
MAPLDEDAVVQSSPKLRKTLMSLLCCVCAVGVRAQGDRAGTLVGGNTYRNAAMELVMTLPGQWQLTPGEAAEAGASKPEPGCDGPLCGKPQISAVLQSTTNASQRVSLIAYKLAPQYLDRKRYPLERFAETMTMGSLGGSGLLPDGDLTAVWLGGRGAYRLLVKRVDSSAAGFGYVGESHDYVFLMVGVATTDAASLRAAIEGMKFEFATTGKVVN